MPRKTAKDPIFPTPRQVDLFRHQLLDWFEREKRDLPWRRTHDPYAILVSEFMLQQTQVTTVIPYYERFLNALPTIKDLANAEENEVLRLWAGLGYYSRARHLHAAARKIMDEYGGKVPEHFADLLFLPGVGRYMAGAVASIAYGKPVPAVDTNVIRVICRVFALRDDYRSLRAKNALEGLVSRLLPSKQPGDFNQALMDLGARICSPREPACGKCPLNSLCKAAQQGNPEDYPLEIPKPALELVEEACAVIRCGPRYFLSRRPKKSTNRYRNMWEFPSIEVQADQQPAVVLRTYVKREFNIPVRILEEWANIRHQVTHHKILKRVFLCEPESAALGDIEEDQEISWFTIEEMEQLPMGTPNRRIANLLRPDLAS